MKQKLTRNLFYSFIAFCLFIIAVPHTSYGAGGTTYYQPNGATFSGTATYCQNQTPTNICANYTTCTSGGGANTANVQGSLQWYYLTPAQFATWSAAGSNCNNAPAFGTIYGAAVPVTTNAATGSSCTLPTTAVAPGVYRYFATYRFITTTTGMCTGNTVWCSYPITINAPTTTPIGGTTTLCAGGTTTTLTHASPGGTWTSSNATVASIGTTTGLVTTGTAGNTTIVYQGATCANTVSVVLTVNPLPNNLTGVSLCSGGPAITMSNSVTGGTWTSSNPAVASVGINNGVVTPGVIGTGATANTTISYNTTCGTRTAVITVNGTPSAITGTNPICSGGATTTLSASANGTWTSSAPGIAAINTATGLVTSGPGGGTTTITYSNGCGIATTLSFSVTAPVAAITGNTVICTGGATTTLSNTTLGGSWTSSVPSVASVVTIVPTGGVVTSGVVPPGTSANTVITYSTGCGAPVSATVTVLGTPGPIIGTPTVCEGFTTTLSAGVAGTWSSANPAIATTTGTGVGTVGGVSGGTSNATVVLTYSNGCAPASVVTFTVTGAPGPITGGPNVCDNGTITLSSSVTGGTWMSTNPANATVSMGPVGGGVVYGILGQGGTNAGILYSNGCGVQTTTVTLVGVPTLITGPAFVCAGANITLSNNGVPAGTWTSSNPAAVSINSTTGVITGGINGTAVITATNSCGSTTFNVTTSTPSAITGNTTFCQNSTTTLSNAVAGGVWTSSNPLLGTTTAVINDGTVYGVPLGGTGCFNITYTLPSGCFTRTLVCTTVAPGPINGIFAVCHGGTTSLTNATPGGTWSTSNSSIITVTSTGLVTGVNPGSANVIFSVGTCPSTALVTVDPLPGAIVGPTAVCEQATISLTDLTPGGGWSVNNGNITISPTGLVTGIVGGTSVVTYTMPSGCYVTKPITINAIPSAITGPASVCVGSSIALSDPTPAGTWGSSNNTIAPVSGSGVVTGGNPGGIANITYTLAATGCFVTKPITVNTLPGAIVGPSAMCTGTTSNVTASPAGGNWTSSNTPVATVDVSTGDVYALTPGNTGIIYTLGTGCISTMTITVNQTPSLISGTDSVCVGLTTNLSNTVSGGVWTSVTTSVATVNPSTGVVTGVFGLGTSEIIYARLGCAVSRTVTVNPLPAPVTGPLAICVGATGVFNSGPAGGTWTSSNPVAAPINSLGVVSGTAPGGITNITYTLPTTCMAALSNVTVNPLPASIAGPTALCAGQSAQLSSNPGTGTWSSSNSTIATITPGGVITAGANPGGTVTIDYRLPTGCNAQLLFTVNPIPAPIFGANSVCAGNSVSLTDVTAGGVWTSSNVTVASITPGPGVTGGVVTGGNIIGTSQVTTITYSLVTGCTATRTFTVNPLPTAITGNKIICAGLTTQLSNGSPFGVWSSNNVPVASVDPITGRVTGGAVLTQQTAVITYSLSTGCTMTTTVTVNPLPDAIIGNLRICSGTTSQLSNATGAGTWTSQLPTVASIDINTGLATGGTVPLPGPLTSRITFTLASTGCIAVSTMTVSALPLPITGPSSVCQGSSITVSSATGGGVWSSTNVSLATISLTGPTVFVNATAVGGPTGLDTIMYTIGTGCMQSKTVMVTLQPDPITGGPLNLCQGSTGVLSDATPGGVWSSSNNAIASVVGGVVTAGTTLGPVNISYTLGSCVSIVIVNVKVQPGAITGVKTMCYGSGTTLSNATPLGLWTSDDLSVAVIGGGGNVTSGSPGMTTGMANITYNVAGCIATTTVQVTPQPTAITGVNTVCNLASTTLNNTIPGGVWTTANSAVAVVDVNGVVTGNMAMPMSANGSTLISYTMPGTGCFAVRSVTVKIQPMPISGNKVVCLGSATQLSSNPGTGVWSTDLTSQAFITVGATGIVTGVGASVGTGTDPIVTYDIAGCSTTTTVSVNPLPSQITGIFHICLGSSTTLADLTPSGTWSSSAPGVANVNTVTGIVSGVGLGSANITYTLPTGCLVTQTVQVIPVPGAITGAGSVCQGFTTPLSSNTFGGTWTSSNSDVATIDPATGVLTGVDAGTVITSYTLGTGCRVIAPMVVYPLQPITGNTTVCSGQTTALSDVTVGGTWTTSNPAVATITSGGLLTGGTPGTAIIGWNLPSGCVATTTVTVQSLPSAITGITTICDYQTTILSNALAGGVWSSSNPTVAGINPLTGDVVTGSGVTIPTDVVISYTLGCSQTTTLTINPVPAAIVGNTNMCLGYTQLFTDATPLGTWSSSNVSAVSIDVNTGLASGDGVGTSTIEYTLPTGCSASAIVVVNPLPSAITGPSAVCVGSTIALTSLSTGGAWTSSNYSIADVGFATGIVTGMNPGTAVITYQVATGCFTTFTVTVNSLPDPVTGPSLVCVGSSITLNTTTPGVTWSSSNPAVAVVTGTGVVTGLTPGVANISPTIVATGCSLVHTVSVNPLPLPITGNFRICRGQISQLANADPGGVWTSSNTFVGTVNPSTGLVQSDANPPVSVFNIIYTLPTGCATLQTMTVVNAPSPISGVSQICVGDCKPLSDTTAGGVWSSFDPTVAVVDPVTGQVCAVSAGFSIITYTMGGGLCYETHVIIVNPLPAPIAGTTEVCAGLTTQLSDATPGGVWQSQNPVIATVVPSGPSAGLVTGGNTPGGVTIITYTLPTSCFVTTTFVTNPLPSPIAGNTNVCLGSVRILSSAPAPGTWSVTNTNIATIDPTSGIITGVSYNVPPGAPYGMTTVTYTINATGCIRTTTVAVHPLPQIYTVTGGGSFCSGTSGVHVGLSGSEIGVNYYLYLGSSTPTGPYAGTGGPLDFGLQTSGGIYTVKANNTYTTCSSDMTGIATITVIPSVAPTVSINPNPNDTVCSGTSVTFVPVATNEGAGPVYNWSVNGLLMSVAASYTFVPANGDVVSVVLNSNAICAIPATTSATLTMTVYTAATPSVAVLVSPNDTVCRGTAVTFTAVPFNGGTAPAYQWSVNGSPVGTSPAYTYTPVNGDLVDVTLTSNANCRLSTTVQSPAEVMRVVEPVIPTVIITASNGSLITAGQSDTLTANVTNGVSPTFQWYINGVPVVGATGSTFVIDNARYGDSIGVMVYNQGFCNEQGFSWMYIQVHAVGVNPVVAVSSDITVVPNPNRGIFTVRGTLGSTVDEEVSLELTNMLGQVVYKINALAKNGKLNTTIQLDNNVANGMYMLNVRTGNEHKVFHLVVEQ